MFGAKPKQRVTTEHVMSRNFGVICLQTAKAVEGNHHAPKSVGLRESGLLR
jgi:hypothetical protein